MVRLFILNCNPVLKAEQLGGWGLQVPDWRGGGREADKPLPPASGGPGQKGPQSLKWPGLQGSWWSPAVVSSEAVLPTCPKV